MTSKLSRSALIAALAVGASGLVAVPAEAANGISTANYYVNQPVVTGVTSITPQSAVLHGAVDTGGNPGSVLSLGAGGTLNWDNAVTLGGSAATSYLIDGLPMSGGNGGVNVTITDSAGNLGGGLISGVAGNVSNAGADNYSNVGFEYDPVADYKANGNEPGPETQYASEVNVPTAGGLSSVSVAIGAFGATAQANNPGSTPLTPGTKYYYWIVQEPGATDAAQDINIAQWAAQTTNPTYKCYPDAAIAQDPTLASYTTSTQITYDGTTAPAIQGPCVYYYGNVSGAIYYDSPTGVFQTPKAGSLAIAGKGKVMGDHLMLKVTNQSQFKAAGTITLKLGGKSVASGSFNLHTNVGRMLSLKLTKAGVKAAKQGRGTKLVLSSNFGQTTTTKSVKL